MQFSELGRKNPVTQNAWGMFFCAGHSMSAGRYSICAEEKIPALGRGWTAHYVAAFSSSFFLFSVISEQPRPPSNLHQVLYRVHDLNKIPWCRRAFSKHYRNVEGSTFCDDTTRGEATEQFKSLLRNSLHLSFPMGIKALLLSSLGYPCSESPHTAMVQSEKYLFFTTAELNCCLFLLLWNGVGREQQSVRGQWLVQHWRTLVTNSLQS